MKLTNTSSELGTVDLVSFAKSELLRVKTKSTTVRSTIGQSNAPRKGLSLGPRFASRFILSEVITNTKVRPQRLGRRRGGL